MKKLLLALLLIPSLAFATDFTSDDLLYGWDGSSQFFQTWADHTAQLSLLYAPLSHVSDTANPHHVTAAQIGVEDGATADQTGQEISDLLDTLFSGTTWRTQIPNTDSQTLGLTGVDLSITGGNSVSFTGWDTDASDDFDGAYASLTGKPTLGTASALDVGTGANQVVQLDSNGDLPFAIGLDTTNFNNNLSATDDDLQTAMDTLDDMVGSSGATAMNDLTDADTATTAPSSGDVLKWDGTNWTPGTDNTVAGAGYVATLPTYSDEACTPGQYALTTTTGYMCVSNGDWNTFALTDWNHPTPVTYTLTVTDPLNGDAITCNDADLSIPINCGNGGTDCSATVADGAEITGLTATADTGRQFDNWTGDVTGSENPTTTALVMSANRAVQGVFSVASTTVNDTFTYSNGLLASVSGGNWADPSGLGTLSVSSNALVVTTNGTIGAAYNTADLGADHCSQVSVTAIGSSQIALIVRMSPTTNTYYKWQAGTVSRVESGSANAYPITGLTEPTTGDTIKLCVQGSTITAYLNDVLQGTGTDTAITTGYAGVQIRYNDTILDDFVGEAL